jgi:valyl-tRNA synthetase
MSNPPFETKDMPKTYDPGRFEQVIYDWWERQGYFKPEVDASKAPFVISMPPPNVTGSLHVGHAMPSSIEDLMIRYHRMRGDPTLWVPGTDHAGIATQNVVERELAKEGLTRHDLGREKFIERVWEWKRQYGDRITRQQRRLGVSCDWSRERFTLDKGLSRAVREAFVHLYEKGLIYRGAYLVNWCPRCSTAISDLEVEHEEEQGKLWYIRYPLLPENVQNVSELDGGAWGSGDWANWADEYVQVATTRPETILGDSAVAVNPEDDRYTDLVGHSILLPGVNRVIPLIADEAVDMEFGTGAVKVTPAHDPTDYEIGKRHDLAFIDIMTDDVEMSEEAGPYEGQDRYECRKNIVKDLETEGLLIDVENHVHAVGHCQRCDTVIEPRISTQWFVKIEPLAKPALEAVRDGRIEIIPARFTKVYYNWMENIRDWCISRQLWWGHRIPVWYCEDCDEIIVTREDPTECPNCGSSDLWQDPDVLDTWFSSGLWPFSTLGWPEQTPDLDYFYPTSVMETGYDILFFWVARMIMQGLEMTDKVPFRTVYLHGLIRAEDGRKMSKSLGNVIDPLEVMDEYGTDALRFTILTGSTPGNDMRLALSRVEANRNFANKVWNAARFVTSNVENTPVEFGDWDKENLELADRWILSRHHGLTQSVTRLMEDYQFGEAGRQIYDFLWNEYCDWYIEITKIRLYGENEAAKQTAGRILVYVLERTLRLLHPFMPFVTEAIWQHLPHQGEALIIAPWPEAEALDPQAEEAMELIMEIVRSIRNVRAEYNVQPGRRISALIASGEQQPLLEDQREVLSRLAQIDMDELAIAARVVEKPDDAVAAVVGGGVEIYLPLTGMVDIAEETQRLQRELQNVAQEIERVEGLLSNEAFCTKAPAEVVQKERDKLADYEAQAEKLQARLVALKV